MNMKLNRLIPSFSIGRHCGNRTRTRWVRSYSEDSSFSHITSTQWDLISQYEAELLKWNTKVNLISRKDAMVPGKIMQDHILPCLSISIVRPFIPGETVLDAGCVHVAIHGICLTSCSPIY